MSRSSKIILAVVAGVLVLCLCGAVSGALAVGYLGVASSRLQTQQVTGPVVRVETGAGGLPGFEMPAGWTQSFSMDVFGFSMVALEGSDKHSHIFLMNAPADAQRANTEMDRLLEEARRSAGSYDTTRQMHHTGQAEVIISGQQVTMDISEGTNHDGMPYRQWVGIFQGRSGMALLSIEQPTASWDQGLVDRFIGSID